MSGHEVTLEPGDHLAAIAAEAGLSDWRTVWDAPENAELRARRRQPGLLVPGDRVFVPDKQAGDGVRVASGTTARFRVKLGLARLRVVVCGLDGKPYADTPCTVTIDGAATALVTGADGLVELALPPGARAGTLEVAGATWALAIGALAPVDTDPGRWARLRNLGYLVDLDDGDGDGAADADPAAPPDPEQLAFAVALFQRDHGLPIDGADLAGITAALKDAYGC